jgi:diguanylate cyclase (GGDEF)-like protein
VERVLDLLGSPLLSILQSSSEGIAIVEATSARVIYANPTLCEWLEARSETGDSLILGDILEVSDNAPDGGIAAISALAQSQRATTCARLLRRGLTPIPVEIRVCRLVGESESLYGVLISAEKTGSAGGDDWDVRRRDPLTGLRDRAFLLSRLAELVASERAADRKFAVLFIDLDNFKQVNDSFGHLVGDNVLREVAQRLTSCMRAHDHIVRFGGDEFVVLAEHLATPDDIDAIIERIHRVLESPIELPEGSIVLTLSIGVAEGSANYRSPDEILVSADRAMYSAKRSAR